MTQLLKTEHGSIDLVMGDNQLLIQFNGPCAEMLPYCQAICCRMRPDCSISLTPEEVASGRFQQEPRTGWLKGNANGDCVYLNGTSCSIHSTKPSICQKWHCSPGGTGEVKAQGWSLFPVLA